MSATLKQKNTFSIRANEIQNLRLQQNNISKKGDIAQNSEDGLTERNKALKNIIDKQHKQIFKVQYNSEMEEQNLSDNSILKDDISDEDNLEIPKLQKQENFESLTPENLSQNSKEIMSPSFIDQSSQKKSQEDIEKESSERKKGLKSKTKLAELAEQNENVNVDKEVTQKFQQFKNLFEKLMERSQIMQAEEQKQKNQATSNNDTQNLNQIFIFLILNLNYDLFTQAFLNFYSKFDKEFFWL